jgi:hypothetical protein
MKKKIFGIIICMMMLASSIPVVESQNNNRIIPILQSRTSQLSVSENWTEIQKLLASDGATEGYFGCSVSLDEDTVLIGESGDSNFNGSAYVFIQNGTTWTQQAKLLASDGEAGDFFGFPVSLYGDTALIGASQDDDNGYHSGSAYVFIRTGTTWTQQAKLKALDGAAGDCFGGSVSLSGDTALIGADGDDSSKGSAYVFIRTGTSWTQQAKLLASDGATDDGFGSSASLDNNTALIGSQAWFNPGSVYVFIRTGTSWTQQAKLLASDGETNDFFGWHVSLSGNTALIGASGDDDNGYESGSAYIFTRTGTVWTEQQKLHSLDNTQFDEFGWSVSICGDTALIGATFDTDNGDGSGSAYVFFRTDNTWAQQAKLLASDGTADDRFGSWASLNDEIAVISAVLDDDSGQDSGSVYIFQKSNENQPPNPPTITGPASGKIKVETEYNFTATDPDNDDVYYLIDWGDGLNSSWIGPYTSGDLITKSHTWTKKGDYTIKAKARDSQGTISEWATLDVTMPYSYNMPFQSLWVKIFERFPNAFPILRHLLGY